MNSFVSMEGKDAVFAALAECYMTVGTKRYNVMQAINLEASMEKNKVEVPRLGKTSKGHKAAGWTGTGSLTLHYNQSVIREMLSNYNKTGEDTYFDIEVTNCDTGSGAGTQTVILRNCNTDGGILAKFDADGEYLDEDVNITFDDFDIPEKFTPLPGFIVSE